ncbi:MAG TPA: CPBP family intramembrane glutamic endopeptidase [Prolixibacteraceae bacterium]|nr:CPBP family intramembrane glutamic endopeptidase [Prolixibacteraceae bacterium]
MYRQALRESKPSTQLLFTALVILISGIAVMVLSIALGWLIYGVNLTEMQNLIQDTSNPKNLSILKFFQTLQSIGVFIIPPFIVAWFLSDHVSVFLRYNNKPDFKSVLLVIAIIYFSNPLINWLTEINSNLSLPEWMSSVEIWMQNSEDQATKITEAFLSTTSLTTLFTNIAMIGILPALGEELLFRGIIQQLFKKKFGNAHVAIWISAALFSALHMQFFGFLPRLVLGAMFGYMLEWSGTLWLPMIAHFVNNATAVVAYYLMQKGLIGSGIDKTGTSEDGSFYLAIVSIIFLFAFFRALYIRRDTLLECPSEKKFM